MIAIAITIANGRPPRRPPKFSVYDRPVPGRPIVARSPLGPNVSQCPRPPALTDAPLLLRFIRRPGAMRMRL